MSLVGRADECRLLDHLLESVRSNESRTLVLLGEPGVGKTALLEHALGAAPDFQVERAGGVESEMELAFAVLHQLCAPMLDRLDRLPEPQREAMAVALGLSAGPAPDRCLVGLAVLGLFSEVAAGRPLLCVVDNAQWVDRASAQVLAFVARRVSRQAVGILLATRRPSEDLERLRTLTVGGLDNEAARELLLSALSGPLDERVCERIIAEAHGNPLALLDLLRGLTAATLGGGFGLLDAHALPEWIEESYRQRLSALPRQIGQILLLAAAEPIGDPILLRGAAERLGLGFEAVRAAETVGLLSFDDRVTFRHPLVRSAIYGSAAAEDRQAVHLALAEMTDRDADPDRRAWHLAAATAGPDEKVAMELERTASRARARGGIAAAAAFLRRAAALTLDPAQRVERALAAAHASLEAGAFDVARALLAPTESGAVDEVQRARADLLRAQIAFASSRGRGSPAELLCAAKRIEPFDAGLARASYLEALSAALSAGRLGSPGGGVLDVARAVGPAPSRRTAADLLLAGWAALFTVGCATAAATLQAALSKFTEAPVAADELPLLGLATITAPVVWDDARWDALSRCHVEFARNTGGPSELRLALNSRSFIHLFRGKLDRASELIEEAGVAVEATNSSFTSWGAVALAALRGRAHDASVTLEIATADATQRGEGITLTVVAWARTLLHNGLGEYDRALAAAKTAIACPTNCAAVAWAMAELIEAAPRIGQWAAAREVSGRLSEIADAAGTDWALGVKARSLAVLSTGATAERLYREALERLGRCKMGVEEARAQLLYGEWLRRESRRVDARVQLRDAFDAFASFGMDAFAERARHELLATGETVRKRTVETRDDLTPQEHQIAELARDGLSNPEIGARLFLSRRTVEWHLRKVFAKLEICCRRELAVALPVATRPDLIGPHHSRM